jgi:polyisoprenoid-binding protein YceI
MTNYLAPFAASAMLFTAACSGAEPPAPKPATAASPAAPAAGAPASPAATPARPAAGAPAAASALPRFVQAARSGSLEFEFVQAGAVTLGHFRQFATELQYDENQLAACRLRVTVQIASLDTQEKDRDGTLASAELLDKAKFPTAQYSASGFAKRGAGLEAIGKLTLHGVTRELRVPLTIRTTKDGVEVSGETAIKRLDYGVGQGDWKSTEWVNDEVKLRYQVPLARAK